MKLNFLTVLLLLAPLVAAQVPLPPPGHPAPDAVRIRSYKFNGPACFPDAQVEIRSDLTEVEIFVNKHNITYPVPRGVNPLSAKHTINCTVEVQLEYPIKTHSLDIGQVTVTTASELRNVGFAGKVVFSWLSNLKKQARIEWPGWAGLRDYAQSRTEVRLEGKAATTKGKDTLKVDLSFGVGEINSMAAGRKSGLLDFDSKYDGMQSPFIRIGLEWRPVQCGLQARGL